jgi:two-component system, NtrC family, response regulator AtoC
MSETLLLVDDDTAVLTSLARYLERLGYHPILETTGAGALEAFERHRPTAVILDLRLPDVEEFELLEGIRAMGGLVILITGHGDVETAVRAMQLGAETFLTKPVDLEHFGAVVARVVEKERLRRENTRLREQSGQGSGLEAVGVSPLMQEVARKVELLARAERTTVLLTGESGTGKGWIARLLHRLSPRTDRPFVDVNCAGLTATFLDSELFGHEKGAYTDAKEQRDGLFKIADTGTLFLDEIGDLHPELQPKLLNVIETRRFRRLGGSREIQVDVRLVVATNRDIQQAVEDERFREDLFYRLNVTALHLPPVRERTEEDRMALIHSLVDDLRHEIPTGPDRLSDPALRRLLDHAWPGNIREMRNVLERALIFAKDEDTIGIEHLPQELRRSGSRPRSGAFQPLSMEEVERRHIERMVLHHKGNRSRAAEALGIARATLINKIKKYGLEV